VDLLAGLIAHYPFDSTVDDESGNNLYGEIVGELSFVEDRNGNPSSAIEFSGSGYNFVRIDDTSRLAFDYNAGQSQSISFWLYLSSNSDPGHVVIKKGKETSEETNYLFGFLADTVTTWGHTISTIPDDCGWWTAMTSRPDINEWNHFAVTVTPFSSSNGIKKLYINGNLISTCPYIEPQNPVNNHPLYLGAALNFSGTIKNHFDGRMDELRIYDRELRPSEVKFLATQ
jgi:hypothetical protein